MERLAWYGPTDRYNPPPGGGMCISVFAVVKKGDSYLIGKPARTERWFSEWIPAWNSYAQEDLEDVFEQWRLPSGYLREGEHPDDCLRRVMREQVDVRRFEVSSTRIFSYATPSDWYPGNAHWDLVFAYDVASDQKLRKLPWWKELRFARRSALQNARFGWNEDFMVDLGILGRRSDA
jgi:ADP-ribose pyrophosphatase YjhB (NUDIX family)